jgi:hypothetical protein
MRKETMNRRQLLTRSLCAGSVLCLGGSPLLAALVQEDESTVHKFQADSGMTYEEIFRLAYVQSYIPTMKVLGEKVGLDVIEEAACEASFQNTAAGASRLPKRDLSALAGFFRNPNRHLAHMLTLEIVEDTDTVFEMKVTECLHAKTFRDADAADLGYRCICRPDYATAEAFNPKIKLIRDKTLMQGHSYCNHRYEMEV